MENMITMAINAKATIKPYEHDSMIVFNESQLNNFLNLITKEVKKELEVIK
jgi:cell division septum initiation protein DivIVA